VGRLVGADLGGDDRALERDADRSQRRVDEIPIGVGERDELPAAAVGLGQRARHLGEDRPTRQRAPERVALGRRHLGPDLRRDLREDGRHDVAVGGSGALGLDARLDRVVALEQARRLFVSEQPPQLAPDARIPVDERPVAVERRPAFRVHFAHNRLAARV
jgi:hypothetical protein